MSVNTGVQEDRLITLHFPVEGDDLFASDFSGSEYVSKPFHFQLTLTSKNLNITPEKVLEKSITVTINDHQNGKRVMNGMIKGWTLGETNRHAMTQTYHADIVPWFSLLKLGATCAIYQNKSVLDLFKTICLSYGFNDFDFTQLKNQYPPKEYIAQYNETDFDFLSRLLVEEGIYYYFQHTNTKHQMMLADQSSLALNIPQGAIYSNVSYEGSAINQWESTLVITTNQ